MYAYMYVVYTCTCTLYCRFVTDLALWRPASPELVERANAAKSLFFSSVDIQPAATAEEKFQMCTKSVLRGEGLQCTFATLSSLFCYLLSIEPQFLKLDITDI